MHLLGQGSTSLHSDWLWFSIVVSGKDTILLKIAYTQNENVFSNVAISPPIYNGVLRA